nr:MAG TPA: Endonuclease [Caudoviricetes sp.]
MVNDISHKNNYPAASQAAGGKGDKLAWARYKGNKYSNKKIEVDGIVFDSKREAKRYEELKLLEQAGEIKDLRRQVKYILIPAQREPDTVGARGGIHKGKLLEKECAYYADFVYYDNVSHKTIVEDTKGVKTTEYIIKRKLMLYEHGIRISEV